jgi:asparagine synthase (glutamine-hydrolysing)
MEEVTALARARAGGVRWPEGAFPENLRQQFLKALGPGGQLLVLECVEGQWRAGEAIQDGQTKIWAEADCLMASRDEVGHRSLFWAEPKPGVVLCASSMAGILKSGLVEPVLDREQVPVFLSYAYVPGVKTLVSGVSALPAGAVLRAGASVSIQPCWSLPDPLEVFEPEPVLKEKLRNTLAQTVARWLPESGPVGATLSGGIDSSLVLALLKSLHGGSPLKTWSVTFGPPHQDELAWSGMVCKHLQIPQEIVLVRPEDIKNRFDETVYALSEPNGDPLTVPNRLLFESASQFTRFLFNGEGGDPCFGGPKNGPMLLSELMEGESARSRAYLSAHQRLFDELGMFLVGDGEAMQARLARELDPWFSGSRGLLDALMAINVTFKGAWHILPKVDCLSADFQLEPCSPLFDKVVVEQAFNIPGSLKRKGATEKYLLKEAVRDLLPAEIVERPKSGMMVPVEAWFSGPLKNWAAERLLDGLGKMGLFHRQALEDLLAGKRGGLRPRRGIKLWLLLTLEAWLRTHGVSYA